MEYRIDNLLVDKGFFLSRQKAKYAIDNKNVFANGKLIEKSSKMCDENATIEIKGDTLKFVSRGGLKLDKAIKVFNIDLTNQICMDIGASTGGFTDCMLQNNAKKVYSVDVGHNQLDEKLLNDNRVINLEGTNIKELNIQDFEDIDFISIDVSFISLTQVLDRAFSLLKYDGKIVILIKPQFEAGKEYINKNGVVKDKRIHERVIEKILIYSNSLGFNIKQIDYSPIKGPAGNIEYLVYMVKEQNKDKMDLFRMREKIKDLVDKSHKELK